MQDGRNKEYVKDIFSLALDMVSIEVDHDRFLSKDYVLAKKFLDLCYEYFENQPKMDSNIESRIEVTDEEILPLDS